MLIAPSSVREQRAARCCFWLLTVAMVILIYRHDCLVVWSEVVAMGEQWLPSFSQSVAPLPDAVVAPSLTADHPPPVASPSTPQTVGDLIADIQQQGEGS